MTTFQFIIPIEQMSKGQKKIADFILKSTERIPFYTEDDIAKKSGVSISTVSRFWEIIGFDNLKAFKKHLQDAQYSTPAIKMKQVLEQTEQHIVAQMIDSAQSNLAETFQRVNYQAFDQAIITLDQAQHIYVHGHGSATALTELIRFRLNRIGIHVHIMAESGHALLESLVHANENDVVLFFGFVRKSPEATVILEQAQVAHYRTILITDLLISEMINDSDIVIQVDRGERDAFHSLVAPMAIIDSISIALAGLRGNDAMNKLQQLHDIRKQYATLLPK
ncbi:MurR/RpiR family transcriptional regulator [Paenibacillus endoradicis]|uniref:MurR/RpiR family transcriptional regulator n=1 Tax=Paenibacillus endoradicis TaxID=2972487 RepID=UPI002158AD50|nr:MurR/RpiR family transcriptional regulator [Paenibacillus endoradicis]MCR8659901.1 MurR/RpiR family transcriptional regulator [Paenibacillus endoradicis]